MVTPKVSVVIPAYNMLSFLPIAVESVLNQTFIDFEVLIINDGSSDGIIHWVSEVTDPRVKLISQENQGLSGARNTGIIHSQGEYIAFLDADDLWEPTKLEKQVRCLEQNPEVGVVDTWIFVVNEQGNVFFPAGPIYETGNMWRQFIEQNNVLCGSTVMVRQCCFDKVGLFDRELRSLEDWHMWVRIAAHYPFTVLQEPLAHYRQHTNSLTKNYVSMVLNASKAIEKIFESVPSNLHGLKRHAYGHMYRGLAGGAYGVKNYHVAIYYYLQAIFYYPQLSFGKGLVRPLLKSCVHICVGEQGYIAIRNVAQKLKSIFLPLTTVKEVR